jgi:flagellar biosynthesis protein FlhG
MRHGDMISAPSSSTLPQSSSLRTRVLAIASGKGGVGKTNIAVNLALALARHSQRVVLVDADLGTANVDVIMNVQSAYGLSDVIAGRRSLDDVAVHLEQNLRLITGASGLSAAADLGPLERHHLIDELAALESASDIILLDCGAGISQNVLAFARAADELLLITTPEPTALTDAYALVKVLSRADHAPPTSLVVNQAATLREAQLVADRVASVAARFLGVGLHSHGHILRDDHVGQAVRLRVPFITRFPKCPAATCIAALARRVAGSKPPARSSDGFFRRALGFFY